mmetsp:Transcript_5057/g.12067  ORF Transcript_5057/g.12067 Transcript_5057/m.12067 type:complete len:358 (+) Transcript_5057:74-1147(+)
MRRMIPFLYLCSLLLIVQIEIDESAAFFRTPPSSTQTLEAPVQGRFQHSTMNDYQPKTLSEIYQSIIQQTVSMTKPWPDSDGFAKCCMDSDASDFVVPTFPEGTGPMGAFALTRDNTHPGNEELVQTCLDAFDQFSKELAIANNSADYFLVKSLVPHITVAIFQEHPQLLPKKQKELGIAGNNNEKEDSFHFFTNEDGTRLAESLARQTSHNAPISLTLDSLILTPDGAMIAGFVDDDNGHYSKLKTDILTSAKQVMGVQDFTSRPKNMIHITCGRVVRRGGVLPTTATVQAAIQDLVRRYNQQVFPQIVAELKSSSSGSTLLVEQMTVLRNDVWLCEKNTVYGIGRLQGQEEEPAS